MDLASLWKKVYAELEVELGKSQTGLYFRNSQLKSLEDGQAVVTFSNRAILGVVSHRFLDKLTECLQKHSQKGGLQVSLSVEEKKTVVAEKDLGPLFEPAPNSEVTGVAQELIRVVTTPPQAGDFAYAKTKLSTKYTFSTFVVGSTNNFAHAAAMSVAKNPGREFNPFFLYGGVGVGKTHLMQAIGNELFGKNPGLKVLYTSAENFMNELIESFPTKSTDKFRHKYRHLDVLMIDDIQFISGKESTQDEIFHTFNSLHQAEKQIVLTSDRRPEEIEKVETRIISRFMGGLTVDIQPPDFEMRTAIITEKLEHKGEKWDREIVEYLASVIDSNIRELEGTLVRIVTAAKVLGKTVDITFVKEQLGQARDEKIARRSIVVAPNTIISVVAKQFGIRPEELLSDKRDSEFVTPRQVTMYLLRQECRINLMEVARLLNRKDHTTVMHAVKKINALSKTDSAMRQHLAYIKRDLWG